MHDEDTRWLAELQQAREQVVFGGTYQRFKDGMSRSKAIYRQWLCDYQKRPIRLV